MSWPLKLLLVSSFLSKFSCYRLTKIGNYFKKYKTQYYRVLATFALYHHRGWLEISPQADKPYIFTQIYKEIYLYIHSEYANPNLKHFHLKVH